VVAINWRGLALLTKLQSWLNDQDSQLDRFKNPIPLSKISAELNESPDDIRAFLQQCGHPIYHVWEHNGSRSKPYCLRLSGRDDVCLDWEDSIAGAAMAVFQQRGYKCRQELGTDDHLIRLCEDPSCFDSLAPGINQRDLWALRRRGHDDREIDLYILEAKGKQASTFDYYCFGQALGQVFPVSASLVKKMGGMYRKPTPERTHGRCWFLAERLYQAWTQLGLRPTITVGLLLPEWSPDILWTDKARIRQNSFYARPLADFRQFVERGDVQFESPATKARSAFRQMLHELESQIQVRSLLEAKAGLRFRILTTQAAAAPYFFRLSGLGEEA